MTLFWIPLILILGTTGSLLSERWGRSACAAITALFPVVALATVAFRIPSVFEGRVIRYEAHWIPTLELNIAFRLDGLSLLFAILILGIGLLVILYARYYLYDADQSGRFYAYLLLFMASMIGVVLANNLLLLWFFWELTSISSFLLIAYWHHRSDARKGARMALTITGAGGLALLGGFILIGQTVGSYDIDQVLSSGDLIRNSGRYHVILLLVLMGAFTKSAQFPFHYWLPHAMAAPTPVSAYLHSATMVKAGLFLLARLYPVLSGSTSWFLIVSITGMLTMLLGAYLALLKHDLKGLLAYSTISHLGLDYLAVRHGHRSCCGSGCVSHHQPRHLQGVFVHGGRDHRPRNRLPGHAQTKRSLDVHAHYGNSGNGCCSGNGRRTAAQRLFVQRDVFCRNLGSKHARVHILDYPWICNDRQPLSPSPIRCGSSTMCSLTVSRRICPKARMNRRAICGCRLKSWWACASSWAFSRNLRLDQYLPMPQPRCWVGICPTSICKSGTV